MKKTTFAILAGLLIGGLLSWGVASLAQSGFWYPISNNLKPIINSYGLRIPSLASCDTVDTDASGIFSCGADASGVYDPVIIQDGTILYSTTTATTFGMGTSTPSFGLSLQASSTDGYFGVSNVNDGDIFVIDESGNVGIGTTNPGSYKLYVSGDSIITGNLTAPTIIGDAYTGTDGTVGGQLSLQGGTGSVGAGGQVEFYGGQGATDGGYFMITGGVGTAGTGGYVSIEGGAGGTSKGNVILQPSSGNVGIGTTTPAYTLDIEGQLHVQATTTMSSSLIVDDGIAATTTVTIGDNTGNYGFCLKVHNSFATGTWLYYTNLDVAGTWGTTSASACGD